MNWDNKQVSLYYNITDTVGRPVDAFFALMGAYENAIPTINQLRRLNPESETYRIEKTNLKNKLPLWAVSANLKDRAAISEPDPEKKKQIQRSKILSRSGLVQIDWDYPDLIGYDYDEVKQAIFELPFIAYVGLSCSGNGIWALAAIAEPERQREYVEHLFKIFTDYGLKPDTSKGRNLSDLRYVSFDFKHHWREVVEPLRIRHFKPVSGPVKQYRDSSRYNSLNSNNGPLINSQVQKILSAQVGQRWQAVQSAAYTLGGIGDREGLRAIEVAIDQNTAFAGEETKYKKCASDCFDAGILNPLTT